MEDENEFFSEMFVESADFSCDDGDGDTAAAASESRKKCPNCKRPIKVCWCQFLPKEKLRIRTRIIILQHPYEESRCLQTAAMLFHAFDDDHCKLYQGKKFASSRYKGLQDISRQPNSILLYPSLKSVNIEDFMKVVNQNNDDDDVSEIIRAPDVAKNKRSGNSNNNNHDADDDNDSSIDTLNDDITVANNNDTEDKNTFFNLFVLDGTWHHAKGIYYCNEFLHDMKQVKLNNTGISKYTIRTQPTDNGLSTVESVALAVSILEDRPDVYETLMKPLVGMCQFQMDHGAIPHHSKEHLLKIGMKYPVKNKIKKK